MNKLIKNMAFKWGGALSIVAIAVTASVANSACAWVMHQDEMPAEAKKLRKF